MTIPHTFQQAHDALIAAMKGTAAEPCTAELAETFEALQTQRSVRLVAVYGFVCGKAIGRVSASDVHPGASLVMREADNAADEAVRLIEA